MTQTRNNTLDHCLGLGLRAKHYNAILETSPPVDFFEILTENYLDTEGRSMFVLDQLAERYPLVMHGVSLSIGSTDPLDRGYLNQLKALQKRSGARWISDHLCWTGIDGQNSHDLLPVPYTTEALAHIAARIRTVQDHLEIPLVIENPSTYVAFAASDMPEYTFLRELVNATGCSLLLDVNNVFVSSRNHGYDPSTYLNAIPFSAVQQFHVAGHTDYGTHIIDTHIGPVPGPVWALLEAAHQKMPAPVLLEWDAEIPDFDTTWAEAERARAWMQAPPSPAPSPQPTTSLKDAP